MLGQHVLAVPPDRLVGVVVDVTLGVGLNNDGRVAQGLLSGMDVVTTEWKNLCPGVRRV